MKACTVQAAVLRNARLNVPRPAAHSHAKKVAQKKKKKTNGDYRRCSAGLCASASGHPAPVVLSKYVQPASLSTLLQQSISFKGGMQIFVLTSYVHFVCNMSDVFFFQEG